MGVVTLLTWPRVGFLKKRRFVPEIDCSFGGLILTDQLVQESLES